MNRSIDWLLIGLLFLSAALHAGLFAILDDGKRPRPPIAMPAVQISLSAPSAQNTAATPGRTGDDASAATENAALPKHPGPAPVEAPAPPSPSPQSVQSSRPQNPLPDIRKIAPPPALDLASAPSPRPTPKPKPLGEPKPPPLPAMRSPSQPAPAPETAPMPEAKAPSPKRVTPGPVEQAGNTPAVSRDAGAHPTGHAPPGPKLDRYLHRIVRRIEAKKHYPFRARTRRIEGRTTVAFRISPQGRLLASHVVNHSGHDILDRAALKAVSDAAPFPKPPQRFRGKPFSLQVVLVFSLYSADTR